VERGHLPDAGLRPDRGYRDPRPRHGRPLPVRHRHGAKTDLGFFRLGAEAYGQAARFPSTTRSWRRPTVCGRAADQRLVGSGRLGHAVAGAGPTPSGNALKGAAHALDCRDSYLRSRTTGSELVGLGLRGHVVAVAMPDAVLVADKSRAQDVKAVVDTLRKARSRPGRRLSALSPALGLVRDAVPRRPVPGEAHHGQARRCPVSLQSHHHRSEHWIVVAGTAEVTIGEEVKLVTENEERLHPAGRRIAWPIPGSCRCT
jgi:mannose-1-phosphate guanylyltransferase/mannose-6-phosphate isomerase